MENDPPGNTLKFLKQEEKNTETNKSDEDGGEKGRFCQREGYNSKCIKVIKDKEGWKNVIKLGGWRVTDGF